MCNLEARSHSDKFISPRRGRTHTLNSHVACVSGFVADANHHRNREHSDCFASHFAIMNICISATFQAVASSSSSPH